MEVYILDSLLRRTEVVDKFESLIWTERFVDIGDFELQLPSTREHRDQFRTGTQLAINNSYRVMTVESVEDKEDADGKELLTVKGRSLEAIFEDRVVKGTISDLTTEPNSTVVGTPGGLARGTFVYICQDGTLDPGDKIPFIQPGNLLPPGNVPEYAASITFTFEPDTLDNILKNLCVPYDLGYRLLRNFDRSQLYFEVYTGNDRTTRQTVLPAVVFAQDFDNLQNITEFSSIEKTKNVAYVFDNRGAAIVYPDDINPDVEGFERRVLLVKTSIPEEILDADVPAELARLGKEELAKNRAQFMFDGELNQYSQFRYGVDYDLGDLVEMRNKDGVVTDRRVTEQIFVCDAEGERSYPTLSMQGFLAADTWLAWRSEQVWADFTTQEWADL